ncbi:hypothetical protein J6590_086734 [Homalodisca vitripennis]|nr:hypothetical protein J6590_086734 [Homalodisca vitripennis]
MSILMNGIETGSPRAVGNITKDIVSSEQRLHNFTNRASNVYKLSNSFNKKEKEKKFCVTKLRTTGDFAIGNINP